MTEKKKIITQKKEKITDEIFSEEDSNLITKDSDDEFQMLRVEDIENTGRIDLKQKVKGVTRITRAIEQPEREIISRSDNKYYFAGTFDPSFMQMQTSEISYQKLQEELVQYGVITGLVAEINSGKEASIYLAHLRGAPLIVKMFRLQLTSHNKQKKRQTGNPLTRATAYATAEFYRLNMAYRAKMHSPTPAKILNNIILMQFIGKDWQPAPQLRNVVLQDPLEMFDKIIEQLKIMYQEAKLIHGDFSEYNILVHENEPFIIDFPQAIDMSLLNNRTEVRYKQNIDILMKDIQAIIDYFKQEYNISSDFDEIFRYILGKDYYREQISTRMNDLEEKIKQEQMIVQKAELRDLDVRGK
ncbi:MAG: hypothetical protein FK734_17590 [Asgard group archaeon]|nr:hypothetical protein [Asgard group archaeon]